MPLTKQYLVGVRRSHLRESNKAAQPSMQVYLTSGNCSQEAIMLYWVKHRLWRKLLNLGCRQLLFVAPKELLQSVRQAEHAVSNSQQPSAAAREPAHLWRHASRLEACQTPLCHRQCQGHAWSRDNILPTRATVLCLHPQVAPRYTWWPWSQRSMADPWFIWMVCVGSDGDIKVVALFQLQAKAVWGEWDLQ